MSNIKLYILPALIIITLACSVYSSAENYNNEPSAIAINAQEISAINAMVHKVYPQVSLNHASSEIKYDTDGDQEYHHFLDISNEILAVSPPGTYQFSDAVRYIKDIYKYIIRRKLDATILGHVYKVTVDNDEINYPIDEDVDIITLEPEKRYSLQEPSTTSTKNLIIVNPGHGYYYDDKDDNIWKYQREEYYGVLEDLKTWEIGKNLKEILDLSRYYKAELTRSTSDEMGVESHKKKSEECAQVYFKRIIPEYTNIWDTASSGYNYDKDINSRPRYANYKNADLLLSIHTNGQRLWNCYDKGTKILYSNNNDSKDKSKRLAKQLLRSILDGINNNMDDLGISEWEGEISNGDEGENSLSHSASVIIEVANHDCDTDASALKNPKFINVVNKAIKDGLDRYYYNDIAIRIETLDERKKGNIRIVMVEYDGTPKYLESKGSVLINGINVSSDWTEFGIQVKDIYTQIGLPWEDFIAPLKVIVLDDTGTLMVDTHYPFHDIGTVVDPSTEFWYRKPVMNLWKKGVIDEYAVGTGIFGAKYSATRAELVKMVVIADGHDNLSDDLDKPPFADVSTEKWYAKYIAYAKLEGWVVGCDPENNLFCPDVSISRAAAAKIISLALLPKDLETSNPTTIFEDVAAPEAWYYPYVYTMQAASAVQGYPDGTFRPGEAISRAALAKIICIAGYEEAECISNDLQ